MPRLFAEFQGLLEQHEARLRVFLRYAPDLDQVGHGRFG